MSTYPDQPPEFPSTPQSRYNKSLNQKFFTKGLSSLSHLLTPHLISICFQLTKSKSLTRRLIYFHLKTSCFRRLNRCLTRWSIQSKKVSKILSGMKILQRQKTRRESIKRIEKQNSGNVEVREVNLEKALAGIDRIVRRVQGKVKMEVVVEMVRWWVKEVNVDFFLRVKVRRLTQSIFWTWKRTVDKNIDKRKNFHVLLGKLLNNEIRKSFSRITKNVTPIIQKNEKLFICKIEKFQNKFTRIHLNHILKASNNLSCVKLSLAISKLSKIKASKLIQVFNFLSKKVQSTKIKKSSKATEIIRRLISNQFNHILQKIFSTKTTFLTLKLSLAAQKLLKLDQKIKKISFNSFKSLLITKYQKYSASAISRKLSNFQKQIKIFSFISIKSFSKYKKQEFSLSRFQNTLKSHQNSLIISSFKSIKSAWKAKLSQSLIWKAKFYLLENLIQHKNEENSLKGKFEKFFIWRSYVEEIKKIQIKAKLIRIKRFYKVLNEFSGRWGGKLIVFAFIVMKNIWEKETRMLSLMAKVYDKQILFVNFERFKRKTQGKVSGSKSRMSVYTPYSGNRLPSPSMPLSTKNGTKRYGFFSTKRLSIDHSVHKYIDQMIRVVPPAGKNWSMSVGNNFKRIDSAFSSK